MNFLTYILVYPILWVISKLPFPVFYFISDMFFVLVYYIIGYRRKTVRKNIEMTMPELSPEQVSKVEKRFYAHLCDIFLEMIKTMTISPQELEKRFAFTNPELIAEIQEQEKSITLFCAHYANWEYLSIFNRTSKYQGYAVYKKINNPYFDKMINKIRSRFGSKLIEMKDTIRVFRANEIAGDKGVYTFVSDQSPMINKSNCWQDFMGIEVPIFTGGEALCKKFNMVPLYLKVEYVKRGHYQCTFIPLSEKDEEINKIPNYEISRRFLNEVEKQIRQAPEYYFWTHKRWKHAGKKPKNL